MTRRSLFQIAAGALAALSAGLHFPQLSTLGFMDPGRMQKFRAAGRHYRTLLDGEDISSNCVSANDRYGWAVVFERGPRGGLILESSGHSVKRIKKNGVVTFQPVSAADWEAASQIGRNKYPMIWEVEPGYDTAGPTWKLNA